MKNIFVLSVIMIGFACRADGQVPKLDNPVSVDYLETHLQKGHPRLFLTLEVEEGLRNKLKTDPVVQNMYAAIKLNAESVFGKPLLKREKVGRRLLGVSREMLWRMNMLGLVYRMEREPEVLARINDELLAVSAFEDWNPSHFLDVGEMSLAFAIALDWTGDDLPESTVQIAKQALLEKGLLADGKPKARIVRGVNNWNQVCNGGMIAAALMLADEEPELAAETIKRALEALPNALVHYGPDGIHPEGSTYWRYATIYTVMTASMLESALGTDFGIFDYPGIVESATFRLMMNTPSGGYYNYSDCGSSRSSNGDLTLAWFAEKTGDAAFFEHERFLHSPKAMGKLPRFAGVAMSWVSQFEETKDSPLPDVWGGTGLNPLVVFQALEDHPNGYYFGAKGGCGKVSHGNMDAGSFIFELNGVRWAFEVGNQSYHNIEKTGFNLWNSKQDGDRWKLLSKNNYGHSTLTVNGAYHRVDGHCPLLQFKDGEKPEAAFDLTPAFGNMLVKATRTFVKDSPESLLIRDVMIPSEKTETIAWQMITIAEVEPVPGGAVLSQDGKMLKLACLSHPDITVEVVSLDPPPLELDSRIKELKRIEINVPLGASIDFSIRLSEL